MGTQSPFLRPPPDCNDAAPKPDRSARAITGLSRCDGAAGAPPNPLLPILHIFQIPARSQLPTRRAQHTFSSTSARASTGDV